ncbi:MAG: Rid family detoxifying hydrolase [Rhabdochlamydiaceae bacterium]|jgi:2-iminobutanoate/2-iminopropanoate deaminase|nr:Rid family detoxifying hydrolase [Rhabdochlamydiaceae bacterium]
MKKIETDQAPQALGPYSQAVEAGGFLFLAGQVPINPITGKIDESSIEGQTRQVLLNIEAILKAAGLTMNYVVRSEVFLKDLSHFSAMNEVYATFFTGPIKPARHTIQVTRLPLDALVEITCTAILH